MAHGHHVLFTRAAWSSSDVGKDLRQNRWLIPPITVESHQELHKAIEMVPVMDPITMARVRRSYEPMPGQFLESMVRLVMATDEAINHPKASEFQKQLGELAIYAVELQMPIIKEGLVWGKQ